MVCGKQDRRGQAGFTMVELMVAIAISVLIVVGSLVFLRYMITVAADNRDKTMATLEVQYVGFWISEDVVQAQTIEVGASHGFPLRLTWEEWNELHRETITYDVVEMEGEDLWRLMRTRDVEVRGSEEEEYQDAPLQSGTSQVAEYLIPWPGTDGLGTGICRKERTTPSGNKIWSLVVEVAARADRSEASSTYEIYPRAVVEWHPQDVDGHYVGPECPVD